MTIRTIVSLLWDVKFSSSSFKLRWIGKYDTYVCIYAVVPDRSIVYVNTYICSGGLVGEPSSSIELFVEKFIGTFVNFW